MNARDLLFAAIETTLVGAADEIEVEPLGDPSGDKALHIFDHGHSIIDRQFDSTRYELRFEVAGYVIAASGPAARTARTALHTEVVRRLMADETLGGLAELLEDEDLDMFTAVLAEKRRLAFGQRFVIQFATPRGDPSRIA